MNENLAVKVIELRLQTEDGSVWQDLSFDLPAGSVTCLHGLSEPARTLLLRMVGGLSVPSRGSILLFGRPLQRISRHWLTSYVHFVSGKSNPCFDYSTREYIRRGAENRLRDPLPKDKLVEQTEFWSAQLDLESLAMRSCRQLSEADLFRANLARAMLCNPALLLLDDPWAKGSQEEHETLTAFFKAQAKLGRTIVCTVAKPEGGHLQGLDTLDLDQRAAKVKEGRTAPRPKEDFLF